MKAKITRILPILIVLIVNISCDQVSKQLVRENIVYNEKIGFLNDHLLLTKVENEGAFLSLGGTLPKPVRFLVLTVIPGFVLLLALFFITSKKNLSRHTVFGASFALGGGIGNLYDRILYGSVTDFLHIDFVLFKTGVFNVADMSIMFGMILILYDAYVNPRMTSLRKPSKLGKEI